MRDSSDGNGNESMQMDIGASVAMGALSLSAGWGSSDSSDMFALGAAYPLGEGVQLDMQLDFGDNDGAESRVGPVPDRYRCQLLIGLRRYPYWGSAPALPFFVFSTKCVRRGRARHTCSTLNVALDSLQWVQHR